ncbi:MAG TPA: hypothetical protein VE131_16870 [Terriglobales bacterium]|jgi:hypothetical protein|nr:hypothetical protein [Terriglobales bacterium]
MFNTSALLDLQLVSLWIKIPYTLFVLVFVPIYWVQYGPANFLWFSDIALFGTLAALWLESSFLASMMTSGVVLFDIVWNVIFFRKLLLGGGPEGLVGYMFDPQISLSIRALSLFHVALPIIQLWSLGTLGYDVRAWKYQVVLGWVLLPLTYAVTSPKENINWVFGITEVPQKWLPPSLYVIALMVIYPAVVCYPTHRVLKRLFVK